ncbi:MAG: PhzF family phenazine biosynthesis protein [Burkholderiales bacterium]
MSHQIHLVDVFALQRYSGNPLAVVVGDAHLPDESMLSLAAEINYSETTFVVPVPEQDGGYRVRIFTPAREIAFAGHPILGTAAVLRKLVDPVASAPLRLNLPVGPVTVTFEPSADGSEVVWFRAPTATPGAECPRDEMAAALGISPLDIASTIPIQQISAGTAAMIVPLRSLEALRRSRLDLAAYAGLAAKGHPPLVYLFCPETRDPGNDYSARFFFEAHGVREDPATGNGAAFLGAYLLEHRQQPRSGFSVRIEQGHEVRRPSLVLLRGRVVDGTREVSVGGTVIPTVRGELV